MGSSMSSDIGKTPNIREKSHSCSSNIKRSKQIRYAFTEYREELMVYNEEHSAMKYKYPLRHSYRIHKNTKSKTSTNFSKKNK